MKVCQFKVDCNESMWAPYWASKQKETLSLIWRTTQVSAYLTENTATFDPRHRGRHTYTPKA